MINASNYIETSKGINFSHLPANFQKGHEYVIKATENGSNWNAYENENIRRVMDGYFQKLNEYLQDNHASRPESVTPSPPHEHKKEIAPTVKKQTVKRNQPTQTEPDEDIEFVERIPDEIKIIKRYLSMQDKKKTKDDFLRFINTLHRAIIERKIRKSSPYAKQIEYIQDKLVSTYNKMTAAVYVNIDDTVLNEFKSIVASEKVMPSVMLIKRYINLNGKYGVKDKAKQLMEAMKRAAQQKKITKKDKYSKLLDTMYENLDKYVKSKTQKILNIQPNELNGLNNILGGLRNERPLYDTTEKRLKTIKKVGNIITFKQPFYPRGTADESRKQILVRGILKDKSGAIKIEGSSYDSNWYKNTNELLDAIDWDWMESVHKEDDLYGCGCELNGIDDVIEKEPVVQPKAGIMNSMDFRNVRFQTLGFSGKYRKLIGDPSKGFSAMVYGKPKMGKSFLCVDFAGYLARNHGKVLYIAKEEGLDMTLQEKLKAKNVAHPNLDVAEDIPDDLSPYDFIFFDSVNKLGLSAKDLETLRHHNSGKSFIFIFQTTKEGNFRGANEFQHDVDIVIEVPEKGLAVQNGRFNQGGEMRIFEE